jgi:hypothetical protein
MTIQTLLFIMLISSREETEVAELEQMRMLLSRRSTLAALNVIIKTAMAYILDIHSITN